MIEAKRQIAAGIVLIKQSGLLELFQESNFSPKTISDFEDFATEIHPKFGRVRCWILFSTGVEYLCKGYLISKNSLAVSSKEKYKLARETDIDETWVRDVVDRRSSVLTQIDTYGTLGEVAQKIGNVLKNYSDVDENDADKVRSILHMLTDAIRNRDAHAYVENVRKEHHGLVVPVCEAINIVMAAIDSHLLQEALVDV